MKTLSYSEVKALCKQETDILVNKRILRKHCKEHNIHYHGVLSYLRGNRRRRNPSLMVKFLRSVGYDEVSSERVITYNFHFIDSAEIKLKENS